MIHAYTLQGENLKKKPSVWSIRCQLIEDSVTLRKILSLSLQSLLREPNGRRREIVVACARTTRDADGEIFWKSSLQAIA